MVFDIKQFSWCSNLYHDCRNTRTYAIISITRLPLPDYLVANHSVSVQSYWKIHGLNQFFSIIINQRNKASYNNCVSDVIMVMPQLII